MGSRHGNLRCFDEFGKPLKASDAIFPSIGCEKLMDFLQFSDSDSTKSHGIYT